MYLGKRPGWVGRLTVLIVEGNSKRATRALSGAAW